MYWAVKKLHCESNSPTHFAIMGNEQLLAIFFLWCRTTEESERLIKETIGKTHMQDDGSLHQDSFGRGVWIGNYFGSLISQTYWWIKCMNGRIEKGSSAFGFSNWVCRSGIFWNRRAKRVWPRFHSSVLGTEWFFHSWHQSCGIFSNTSPAFPHQLGVLQSSLILI